MEKHLKNRGIEFDRYPNLSYDDETVSFRLFTPTGLSVGFQQYRPSADKTRKNNPKDGRYYTYVTNGYLPIWGFETLNYRRDILFTCEGIFKAVRLHRLNLPAVALLGNDSKIYQNQIHLLNRYVIAICDPDQAGKKMGKIGHVSYDMDGRYLDEMSDDEVRSFLERYIAFD